jgi:thiamine pyrophosphokinase
MFEYHVCKNAYAYSIAHLQFKYRVDGVWRTSVKEPRVSSNEVGSAECCVFKKVCYMPLCN